MSDGYRSSIGGPAAVDSDSAVKTAFVFGGSTTWGAGVKDDYTIPSYLNRLASGRYRFFNYGVLAYQSTQEVLRLSLLLSDGNVPDLVVLYDGVNDAVYGAVYGPGNQMAHGETAERFAGTGRGILSPPRRCRRRRRLQARWERRGGKVMIRGTTLTPTVRHSRPAREKPWARPIRVPQLPAAQ